MRIDYTHTCHQHHTHVFLGAAKVDIGTRGPTRKKHIIGSVLSFTHGPGECKATTCVLRSFSLASPARTLLPTACWCQAQYSFLTRLTSLIDHHWIVLAIVVLILVIFFWLRILLSELGLCRLLSRLVARVVVLVLIIILGRLLLRRSRRGLCAAH